MPRKSYLAFEFFILCLALPTVIIAGQLAPLMFFFLWGACAACWLIYRRYHYKDVKTLWKWHEVKWENFRPILLRYAFCATSLLIFTWLFLSSKLFYMIEHRPHAVPWIMVLYPVLSALPQEFIFCTFFFDRYAVFFKTDRQRILASATVFSYAHCLYGNIYAPFFSFIGGLIFASTFAKTRSLALVAMEHGLYGDTLFLIGLGYYFWTGAMTIGH